MPKTETDVIRQKAPGGAVPDPIDRKILSELAGDATQSFAALGEAVGLSPPAVHERVKRLRRNGTIRGTSALLEGTNVGKPLLAFVHVDTAGWGKTRQMIALGDLPEVEEIHSVAGDTGLIIKVRVVSSDALEGLLARIYDLPNVRTTRTSVVLSTHLERPVQAGITPELEEGPHIK